MAVVFTVSRGTISPGYSIDFWERLRRLGWVKGENLRVEEHWADGRVERMPTLIAEAVGGGPDLILTGTEAGAIAAAQATRTIPIVVVAMADPLSTGVVTSLSRPGGNLTGLSLATMEGIPAKCLELLFEAVPRLSVVAVLWNPDTIPNRGQLKQVEALAPQLKIRLRAIAVRSDKDIPTAFEQARQHAQAVLLLNDPLMYQHRRQIADLATKNRLPLVSSMHDVALAGGLIGYGADFRIMYRRAAEYVDKVLRGVNAGDLPIEQPTQLKLTVNLRTSKALGMKIPEAILVRADDVIR